eukprot:TRINITY_DN66784_c0_g1_i1.p1 TRINITY_DN66784_c0_g1~~TRINITY_DN66784_c0_g1_i1.p1  ORF type:complete len:276 (-),score=22.67 TRINITY_DN66784_c0_g1_i1:381-1208(-)
MALSSKFSGTVLRLSRSSLRGPWRYLSSASTRTRELSNGWSAVYSPEHNREYFWHQPTGSTTWDPPAESVPVTQDVPATEREAQASGTSASAQEIASTPTGPTTTSSSASAHAPTLRARDLPAGWVAVHSPEHDREYYWHRESNMTQWEKPSPQVSNTTTATGHREAAATMQDLLSRRSAVDSFCGNIPALQSAVSGILRKYPLGKEVDFEDFRLLRELVEYHPDVSNKVGAGIRAIKVDASLHEDGSRCFWVLRTDGTSEDFSARKCVQHVRRT